MKTSRSSMSLSSSASGASDTAARKLTYDSMTIDRQKKPKRPSVIAQITRRTKSSQPTTKKDVKEPPTTKDISKPDPTAKEPTVENVQTKKKLLSTKDKSDTVTSKSKMATLPRMFKPKSSKTPVSKLTVGAKSPTVQESSTLGRNTLTKSPSLAFHEVGSASPPVKRQTVGVSKTVSLSFNELKKQHQYSLREAEDLRLNMMQMDQRHAAELDGMRNELHEADSTVAMLRNEIKAKDVALAQRDTMISNLEAQCLKLELEKDRLLMVIECAQRDALTGEKVIPDITSWQSMVDQAHSQTEQFLIHIESMSTTLQRMEGECKEQADQIEAGIDMFKDCQNVFVRL